MQTLNRATEDEFRNAGVGAAANEVVARDLIQRYKVCWEVWPEWVVEKSHLEKTGFELELLGTHAEGTEQVSPGCVACVQVYYALVKVARYIVPRIPNLPT